MNRSERRAHAKAGGRVLATVAGWAEPDDEEDLRRVHRETHDALVRGLGRRRAGPVTWTEDQGEAAKVRLGRLEDGCVDPELVAYYAETRRLLEARGGVLVVAQAPTR